MIKEFSGKLVDDGYGRWHLKIGPEDWDTSDPDEWFGGLDGKRVRVIVEVIPDEPSN